MVLGTKNISKKNCENMCILASPSLRLRTRDDKFVTDLTHFNFFHQLSQFHTILGGFGANSSHLYHHHVQNCNINGDICFLLTGLCTTFPMSELVLPGVVAEATSCPSCRYVSFCCDIYTFCVLEVNSCAYFDNYSHYKV